ncbi:hypothetical protein D0T84_05365 [Dysgonomonas sp. 521]|uniref:hypothetical protein n=1 Tax=Dysgonomonas sp. 521 TaxID=2302932 RepID=UPI0013D5616D|nr:hypothetical protein [Dysgonomonas sp. 521]NDV94347.1 hypothetical protein [Dysgonomonas sp. 521]
MKLNSSVRNGQELEQESTDSRQFTPQENQDNSESNGNIKKVEGLPFNIVVNEYVTYVTMGNNILGIYTCEDEAREAIDNKDWQLILTAGVAMQAEINNRN